jgi:hypothetical protein
MQKSPLKITEAAKQKHCSRMQIYRAIKEGKLNLAEVHGKTYVQNDAKFTSYTVSKHQHPAKPKISVSDLADRLSLFELKLSTLAAENDLLKDRLARLEAKPMDSKATAAIKATATAKPVVKTPSPKGKTGKPATLADKLATAKALKKAGKHWNDIRHLLHLDRNKTDMAKIKKTLGM